MLGWDMPEEVTERTMFIAQHVTLLRSETSGNAQDYKGLFLKSKSLHMSRGEIIMNTGNDHEVN